MSSRLRQCSKGSANGHAALMLDPNRAVCSLDEIKAMFDELYEAEKAYIAELN